MYSSDASVSLEHSQKLKVASANRVESISRKEGAPTARSRGQQSDPQSFQRPFGFVGHSARSRSARVSGDETLSL